METAGNFVTAVTEFTACMKYRHNYFNSRFSCFMHVHRNTASVIFYCYTVICINSNLDIIAKTGKGFINTVINNFGNQVVQTATRNTSYIHTGALANCFQPFQHLDLAGSVLSFHPCSFFNFLFNFFLFSNFINTDFFCIFRILYHCFVFFSHSFLHYDKLNFY